MSAQFIIGIGAQKAGTTWLSEYLDKHPDVCFSPRKEMHHFDAKYLPELCGQWNDIFRSERKSMSLKRKLKWVLATGFAGEHAISYREFLDFRIGMTGNEQLYLDFFNKLNRGQKYNAEVTPSYSMLGRDGFEAIRNLLPGVKIIFIMRNPVDRFWSNMRHIQGKYDDFDAKRDFMDRLNNDQNVLRTDYKRTVELVDSVFPAEDVLYLFYEHLFKGEDREQYALRIPAFLGIEMLKPDVSRSVAKSLSSTLSEEARVLIIRRFQYVYEFVMNRFNEVPGSWLEDLKLIEDVKTV